ncbi:peptide/nickel transport system permease protein [Haloactinopolyspora alba]|uniref:Peptide/nickel transport system permease protein n=1 Tax=Haloactinopolyspora alba TaxID=648780 RepID=A0A2P8D9D1_9ACTN|nr:ABC transporter permease [Haloactinopolyspora alba]PSK93825.1 peptide/nickel transport system permease protein [Haloactinopolyspora alba]
MLKFVVRRLLMLVPILIGLSALLFAWLRALPGGPAVALLGERATPESIARVEELYGLNEPWYVQYGRYLSNAVQFDFGNSTRTNRPVTEEMARTFPATFELALAALILAIGIGIPLGYLAARHYGRWLDNMSVTGSLLGVAIPVFFLAYILKYVFAVRLGWFPTQGRQDPRMDAEHPTGMYVLDGLLTGNLDASWDALMHLVLPALALGSIPLAIIVRITRASVLDVVHEDYVRTAEAKGLWERTITRRHVLRNALLPVVTVVGLQAGLLFSGAILTETVFAFDGVGRFVAEAISNRDYAVLQGFILVIAVLYVVINLLVDVSYGLIDPRVRVR